MSEPCDHQSPSRTPASAPLRDPRLDPAIRTVKPVTKAGLFPSVTDALVAIGIICAAYVALFVVLLLLGAF